MDHSTIQDYVQLLHLDKTDIAAKLIANGLLRTEKREEKKVVKLVRELHDVLYNLIRVSIRILKTSPGVMHETYLHTYCTSPIQCCAKVLLLLQLVNFCCL